MTYRTNDRIENPTQDDQNLKHIRELCEAKLGPVAPSATGQ